MTQVLNTFVSYLTFQSLQRPSILVTTKMNLRVDISHAHRNADSLLSHLCEWPCIRKYASYAHTQA